MEYLLNQAILITGGTGSWGQELTRQLLYNCQPKEIRIYSRGEHKQVGMRRRFNDPRLRFYIGDIRDKSRLMLVGKNVDTIFHLAALKHVPVCEENPWEAIQTNIIGTQNVIETALAHKAKKVVYVSSDKAVDPFNLYGATKSCGEQLILDGNRHDTTRFVSIRAGNVIGTSGSVVPLFRNQILKNNEVTITHSDMTRFFMRIREAVGLLLKAARDSIGGEILVMKMPACKITDVADVMIEALGNKNTGRRVIGIRPGEKISEVLVSRYEVPFTLDLGAYFVILPITSLKETGNNYKRMNLPRTLTEAYDSHRATRLEKTQIMQLLKQTGWIPS